MTAKVARFSTMDGYTKATFKKVSPQEKAYALGPTEIDIRETLTREIDLAMGR